MGYGDDEDGGMRNEALVDLADEYAWALLTGRIPYRWGGDDPLAGLDCSGMVLLILQGVGRFPWGGDMNADGLWHKYPRLAAHEAPRRGCLVLYGKPGGTATHVAWVTSVIDGKAYIIEAGGGGPSTTDEAKAAQQNAYIKLAPANRRGDILGFVDPFKEAT